MGRDHVVLLHVVVEGDIGLGIGVVLRVVEGYAIIEVESAPSLIVLIQENLQRNPIVDTFEQGDAVLVLEDWDYGATLGEDCLLVSAEGLVVHPSAYVCVGNFNPSLPLIPDALLRQVVIDLGQAYQIQEH